MTVAEYEVRFMQLSHYAQMIVASERDQCRWFEEGLNYDIRSRLTLSDLCSYQNLRAAAIRAERLLKEKKVSDGSKIKKTYHESRRGVEWTPIKETKI